MDRWLQDNFFGTLGVLGRLGRLGTFSDVLGRFWSVLGGFQLPIVFGGQFPIIRSSNYGHCIRDDLPITELGQSTFCVGLAWPCFVDLSGLVRLVIGRVSAVWLFTFSSTAGADP